MSSIQQWAFLAMQDKEGKLSPDKSSAFQELKNRAGQAGQTLAQYVEPALTVASGMAGHLAGIAVGAGGIGMGVDAAENAYNRTQDWMTYRPRTESGQAGLEWLGDKSQVVGDAVNKAIGQGAGAVISAIPGQTAEAAPAIQESITNKGLGKSAEDYITQATGSPTAGKLASWVPGAVELVAGGKGIMNAAKLEMGDIGGQGMGNQRGAVGGIQQSLKGGEKPTLKMFVAEQDRVSALRAEKQGELLAIESSPSFQADQKALRANGIKGKEAKAKLDEAYPGYLKLDTEVGDLGQLQQRTYKEWAGIVDKPLANNEYFHGTSGEWDSFDMDRQGSVSSGSGEGIWLTKDREYASEYADNSESVTGEPANIKTFKASPKNPLTVNFKNSVPVINGKKMSDLDDNKAVLDYARKMGFDAIDWVDGSFTDAPSLTIFDPDQLKEVQGQGQLSGIKQSVAGGMSIKDANKQLRGFGDGAYVDQTGSGKFAVYDNDGSIGSFDTLEQAVKAKTDKAAGGSYKVQHEAPMLDSYPSASDLNDVFPDVYSGKALQYYGTGVDYDNKAISIIKGMNANPSKAVTVYRAVPKDVTDINPGDWITTTKQYALDHIGDDDGFHIITKKVKPGEMASDGNSIHEFGYDPSANKPTKGRLK